MKKITALFSVFLLLFSASLVFAQMPISMPGAVMPSGLERIGVVAAAGGQVELTTPGQVGRIAQSGQPIFMGDLVSTDAKGHLQILLLDETVFTIGPNSAITIDKFVYDPKTQGGEIKASITKGVFRYVSGKIAVKNPQSVTVKLPTATLGFRGTIVGGSIQAGGQGLVGLLGPGDNNDAGAQSGSFTVEGQGGDQQGVDRTGFGVEIGADGGISGVFQMSQDQVNGLTQGLGGGQDGGGGSGGDDQSSGLGGDTDMGGLSGETGALTGDMVGLTEGLAGISDDLSNLTTLVAQDAAQNKSGIENGTTKVSDLAGLSGSYSYSGSGSFTQTLQYGYPSSTVGSFTASWTLNLATAQLENINIAASVPYPGNISSSGVVSYAIPVEDLLVFSDLHDPNNLNLQAEITISNVNGEVARDGTIKVVYNDNSPTNGNIGNGEATISHT